MRSDLPALPSTPSTPALPVASSFEPGQPRLLPGHELALGDPRLPRFRARVLPEWIDGNRHMNACYYLAAIKEPAIALHAFWDYGPDFRARTGESNFVLSAQVVYARELLLDDPIVITVRISELDGKRMTLLFELLNERTGELSALVEYLLVHVRLGPPPRSHPMPADLLARLTEAFAVHAQVPWPPEVRKLASWKGRAASAAAPP